MIGKFILWAAVAAGLTGFFLPLVTSERDGKSFNISAMNMVMGAEKIVDDVTQKAADDLGATDEQKAMAESLINHERSTGALDEASKMMRSLVFVMFAPTVLLLLTALLSLKRFGRGLASLALIAGLAGVGLWALATSKAPAGEVRFALGMTLVLVGGALGTISGIAGLAKPEPKPAA